MFPNFLRSRILAFGLYLSLTINAEQLSHVCPPQESLPSCSCKQSPTGPTITCNEVSSTLLQIISALKGYAVARLSIVGAEIDTVSPDDFKGLHIKDLSVSNLEVKESLLPDKRYLQGLENSLTSLAISKSFKSKPLVTLRTDHLRHLEVLLLEDNEIQEVTIDWFSGGPTSLKTLIFERNHIKSIGDEAFADLKNLRTFALAGNSLTRIPRSVLPQPAYHLNTLDLAYNRLTDIPEDFFSGMPALRSLNLDHNIIATLSEKAMSPIWNQLSDFNFLGNPLRCDSEIKWLCRARRVAIKGKCQNPPETAGKDVMDVC